MESAIGRSSRSCTPPAFAAPKHARGKLLADDSQRILFLTTEGNALKVDSLTEYVRRYIRAAGITKPGACHIFRHSMATAMHDGGADIRTIQAILGHERLDTTQIYTRVGLKKLLETHARTHPAERRDEDQLP
jgi:integrase/recombinase XerD